MKNINLNRVIKSMEEKVMRTLGFIVIVSLFLASCSSTYDASVPYDEVYASGSTPAKATTESVTVRSQAVESTTAVEGEYYSPEYEEGEFDSEGYYDYEYSSRIKRFQDDNPGFDYYSNYYTDNYYYTNDPYYIGSDIYSGCGCCSGVSLSFGFGYGWGYPYYGYYYPWYYDPWYYPYYGYGWGYGYPGYWGGSYWAGYYDGYWDGYYWGGGGYYPEPYPGGGYYYGHRNSRGGSSNGSNTSGSTPRDQRYGNDEAQLMSQSARGVRTDGNVQSVNGSSTTAPGQTINKETVLNTSARADRDPAKPVSPSGSTATKTDVLGNQPAYNKPAEASARTPRTADETVNMGQNTSMSESRRVQPEMKYEKPKTYTSPSYRTTPSNQEYSSPASRESRPVSSGTEGTTRKVYSTTPERKVVNEGTRPTQESGSNKMNALTPSQKYTSPSRSSERSYSSPSNSGSRSYSSPSSSGSRSYSAPSRSYSSPSYNSGSSGGSRSSGSSGGGMGGSSSGGARGGRR